ncbi:MAG: hypothetical protein ABFS28_15675 [Bacteroidota bacterium]
MKTPNEVLLISIAITFASCSPTVTTSLSQNYPPLDYDQEVMVFHLDQNQPKQAVVLGEVKIGDSGFSINCGYPVVLKKAKLEARKLGGNAIKIIKHKLPHPLGSTCHRITAIILRVENIDEYEASR